MRKRKIIERIGDYQQLQVDSGSNDDYGQGLYNGMELAKSLFMKEEPTFFGLKEWKRRGQK